MPHLCRCPASLADIVAKVLARQHLTSSPPAGTNGNTSLQQDTTATYTATVAISGRQMADFADLMDVARNHLRFVWTDPADGRDKLVAFATMPEILTTDIPHADPDNVFTVRFCLRYDPGQ